ncbi:lipocalin family protein [Sunxiuqinia sp. sy24]|uniref:lipocalin family protein n=1 Tax=Sunxiuqinia sp. sy24 TaxID=3461495 RepID=UPI004045C0A5
MNKESKNTSKHTRTFLHIFSAAVLLLLAACSTPKNQLTGSWTQPIPGQETKMQGFKLDADGKASSINMSTLQYESWSSKGKQLMLTGKSIGNGQTIDFTDTLLIQKKTADSLIIKRGNLELAYGRQR